VGIGVTLGATVGKVIVLGGEVTCEGEQAEVVIAKMSNPTRNLDSFILYLQILHLLSI